MFTAAEAERLIFTLVSPITSSETVDVADNPIGCLGRILAVAPLSPLDFPHWDNSAMDGYAVRTADVQTVPVTLQVIEEIPAGKLPQKALAPGQAARILTGAMLPEGADAVVMQEETEREVKPGSGSQTADQQVVILRSPPPQNFVRQRGSFAQVGDALLTRGQALGPTEIALLAAAQQPSVRVYRRPRVAILSTGNELVTPHQPLQPGQIVDSNQYALTALVAQTGAIPVPLGIVPDDRAEMKRAIAAALAQADMVLSSGGVSVGDYDYVDDVLAELGATLHIRSVAVKPGKPLTVATVEGEIGNRQLYFGLPGNPASAMVGFWRFVAPAIAKLSGHLGPWLPEFVWATATADFKADGQRETYLWGQLSASETGYDFAPAAGSHSSGNLINLANTSGLGIVPQGSQQIMIGQPLRVLTIRSTR